MYTVCSTRLTVQGIALFSHAETRLQLSLLSAMLRNSGRWTCKSGLPVCSTYLQVSYLVFSVQRTYCIYSLFIASKRKRNTRIMWTPSATLLNVDSLGIVQPPLCSNELLQVFEMFGADIGLTTKHVLKIMAEADDNSDGVIEYKECGYLFILFKVPAGTNTPYPCPAPNASLFSHRLTL